MQNEVVPALRQCVVATQASAVKLKIVDALLWLHLPSQPTVTPVLMRSAVHLCTPSQSPVAGYAIPALTFEINMNCHMHSTHSS